MRICVRLLVVLTDRTAQPAVCDRAVVAHLRAVEVREILADALVNLLVEEDAVGPRDHRDGHPQPEDEGQRHAEQVTPIDQPPQIPRAEGKHRQAEGDADFERPELQEGQLAAKRRRGRP